MLVHMVQNQNKGRQGPVAKGDSLHKSDNSEQSNNDTAAEPTMKVSELGGKS